METEKHRFCIIVRVRLPCDSSVCVARVMSITRVDTRAEFVLRVLLKFPVLFILLKLGPRHCDVHIVLREFIAGITVRVLLYSRQSSKCWRVLGLPH